MPSFITKFFSSETFSITSLVLIIALITTILVFYIQKQDLNKKIDLLNKTLDTKEEHILDLEQQIKMKEFEIQYLQKGMNIAQVYEQEKEKVLQDDTTTKVQVIQTAMSNEENKDWWNTPIPSGILDIINTNMCN